MADEYTQYVPNYVIDNELIDSIHNLYANVLDRSALNVADPISANIGYFNITGKRFATDPPVVGKTYVFMTRPNLNFKFPNNILRSHVFQYYSGTKLGRTLMTNLMYNEAANRLRVPDRGSQKWIYPKIEIPFSNRNIGGVNVTDEMILSGQKTNFIPIITNTCTESSNSKDINLSTFETDGDFSGNKLVYAAGIDETLSIGEFNLTFDDMYYSPIMHLFTLWVMYIHYATKGIVTPYWDYVVNRIIDYTSSIYIFMLDIDGQTIIRYARYGGCFPRTIPFGAVQHSQEPNTQALRNMQITFSYNFYEPMNPMSLIEFNMLSEASLIERNSKFANLIDVNTHSLRMDQLNEAQVNLRHPETSEYEPDKILNYKNDYSAHKLQPGDDLNLLNRKNDMIRNNWDGIPFIVNSNKLMFI